jgi:hypothetical protein
VRAWFDDEYSSLLVALACMVAAATVVWLFATPTVPDAPAPTPSTLQVVADPDARPVQEEP